MIDEARLAPLAQQVLDAIRQAHALTPMRMADLPLSEQRRVRQTAVIALRRHELEEVLSAR